MGICILQKWEIGALKAYSVIRVCSGRFRDFEVGIRGIWLVTLSKNIDGMYKPCNEH